MIYLLIFKNVLKMIQDYKRKTPYTIMDVNEVLTAIKLVFIEKKKSSWNLFNLKSQIEVQIILTYLAYS